MFIAEKHIQIKKDHPYKLTLTLMSDLHFGARNVDTGAIREDLEEGALKGDRILINGDVFDMILPSDRKRYRPEALAQWLQGRSDMLNTAIAWAAEFLDPFKEYIDMIGIGNHEEAVEKHHSYDPVQALIYELNKAGAEIKYGGISGFFVYRILDSGAKSKTERQAQRWRYVVYYHHGAAGSSPVTKGMIDFNRMETWVDSDLIWIGHKHNRIMDGTTVRVGVTQRGNLYKRPFRAVMTGGYMDTLEVEDSGKLLAGKPRQSGYAESKCLPPQDKGGCRVEVGLARAGHIGKVRVIM